MMMNETAKPGGKLQSAITAGGNVAYLIHRTFFSRISNQLIPEPTRAALFQLFCDLRANTPKDSAFMKRHMKAFTPQTPLGWLALAGVLSTSLSSLLALCTITLSLSIGGLFVGMMAMITAGIILASTLGFLAFVMFLSAFSAAAVACVALSGYVFASSSVAVMKHIVNVVFHQAPSSMLQSLAPDSHFVMGEKQSDGYFVMGEKESDSHNWPERLDRTEPSLSSLVQTGIVLEEGEEEVPSVPIPNPSRRSDEQALIEKSNTRSTTGSDVARDFPGDSLHKSSGHCIETTRYFPGSLPLHSFPSTAVKTPITTIPLSLTTTPSMKNPTHGLALDLSGTQTSSLKAVHRVKASPRYNHASPSHKQRYLKQSENSYAKPLVFSPVQSSSSSPVEKMHGIVDDGVHSMTPEIKKSLALHVSPHGDDDGTKDPINVGPRRESLESPRIVDQPMFKYE